VPGQPDRDGNYHLNLLESAPDKTRQHWGDNMSRHFDTRCRMPMLNEPRACLSALHKLMELLVAAERDTEC